MVDQIKSNALAHLISPKNVSLSLFDWPSTWYPIIRAPGILHAVGIVLSARLQLVESTLSQHKWSAYGCVPFDTYYGVGDEVRTHNHLVGNEERHQLRHTDIINIKNWVLF